MPSTQLRRQIAELTAHHPTVSDGRALVLYLLPDGSIEFIR
jgi:hypothetical protein